MYSLDYCSGESCESSPGCSLAITDSSIAYDFATRRVLARLSGTAAIPIDWTVAGVSGNCTMQVHISDAAVRASIAAGAPGLTLRLTDIDISWGSVEFTGCSSLSQIANQVEGLLRDALRMPLVRILEQIFVTLPCPS